MQNHTLKQWVVTKMTNFFFSIIYFNVPAAGKVYLRDRQIDRRVLKVEEERLVMFHSDRSA